jgi:translocation and assembly module TamA
LLALDRLATMWRDDGWPEAELLGARHSLDRTAKTLETEVSLSPGPYAVMGELELQGDSPVKFDFLRHHALWRPGQPWRQREVDLFRETLLQTGLFKSVEADPAEADGPDGRRAVTVAVDEAPPRTVGGSVNFDSNFGPGLQLSWEHRNITGWGDKLRLELPVWADLFQLAANYQRPFFLSPKQNLIMRGSILHERADSYTLKAVSAAAGVDRLLHRSLRLRLQASLETGELDEELTSPRRYRIVGWPAALEWDRVDSLLDPVKGWRVALALNPYYGHYLNDFHLLKWRLDASFYQPVAGKRTLTLAVRGALGAMTGAHAQELPASLRFYGGGGKSLRGFEYQSVGPRNALDKPAGGDAMNEVSAELRWRWSETMGVTAFVDGGMVYEKSDWSELGRDFLWGGGLGFRYYTPIGPFRLDLATPLNPRQEDDPFQFYLSLGQSF